MSLQRSNSARNLEGGNKSGSGGLGSFLDFAGGSKKKSGGGAATVAGDQVTGGGTNKSDDGSGEVYIRADGKKVRRVKRVVRKTKSSDASSGDLQAAAAAVSQTKDDASSADGEVYVRPDGKKVRRVKKVVSGSGSVAGTSTASSSDKKQSLGGFLDDLAPRGGNRISGAATVSGDQVTEHHEGEIVVRADGKKVRRIKKTVVRAKSSSSSAAGDDSGSVADDTAAAPLKRSKSLGDEGEVYVNAEGKRVRRIVRKSSGTSSDDGEAPASTRANQALDLGGFIAGSSPVRKSNKFSSATVAGDTPTKSKSFTEGEVYIRADGKKVRRVKRGTITATAASAAAASSTLAGFLDVQSKDTKTNTRSGAATVSGDVVTKDEGEIIVRADGKKVRRIKKTVVRSMSSRGLNDDAPGAADGASEPTTVLSGDAAKPAAQDNSELLTPEQKRKKNLQSFLDSTSQAGTTRISGAATVTGTPTTSKNAVGEIYINSEGKKVRRVRKSDAASVKKTGSVASDKSGDKSEGEIYIRADGKKVRRVRKSSLANKSKGDENKKPAAKKSSSASVAGDKVIKKVPDGEIIIRADGKKVLRRKKQPNQAPEDGEVYRRADGKLVRRVKRNSDASTATAPATAAGSLAGDLAGFLDKNEDKSKDKKSGESATVAGDAVGRAKSSAAKAPTIAPLSEVFDSKQNSEKPAPPRLPTTSETEPVIESEQEKNESVEAPSKEATSANDIKESPERKAASAIQLTEDEEALAAFYRKKLKMGLPEPALRHKMIQDGVDEKIIAAVLGGEYSGPGASPSRTASTEAATPSASEVSSSALSAGEEDIASRFRKMMEMGLPADIVRHKMIQEGVDENIISAVLGGDNVAAALSVPTTESTPTGAPASASGEEDAPPTASLSPPPPPPTPPASAPAPAATLTQVAGLTDDEEAVAARFRKMAKMGLPEDVVRHKMAAEGVEEKIVDAVFSEQEGSAAAPEPSTSTLPPPAATPPASQGYSVVEGDIAEIDPNEKFAVKVSGSDENGVASSDAETKYMTLEQIAKISGQSRDQLESMVTEKRRRAASPPRFVLQPETKKEDLYPVQIPKPSVADSSSASTPATPADVTVPPAGKVAPIGDGQEVVDSSLAQAARAVSALGSSDMAALLEKLQAGDMGDLIERLREAEKRQKKLEKQLAQAGIGIAEDIEYNEAKQQVEKIAKRMNEIGGSDVTAADKEIQNKLREEYFKLEQQMERYNTAMMLTDEYQAEQNRLEKKWDDDNAADNLEALKKIRRHMPVQIRNMSEAELTNNPSPNGKFLPKSIAKKFKRTNVLQCLRLNPDDIERMHPSTLENMRVTGLTLTERRALYCHLKVLGPRWEKNKSEKMTERKWTWYQMMKNNFKENLAPYQRHVEQYGPPGNHPYATRDNPNSGCPLIGKQCPIKADLMSDYSGDYGYTEKDEYEVSEVRKADTDDPGAKAMLEALELAREKKANERADLLKKHYKGKLLQVSKANGSCEAMDETMDKMENHTTKWIEFVIDKGGPDESEADKSKELANFTEALNELKLSVLDFAQRSGMQISGAKKKGAGAADPRSSVEAGLSEELYECSQELFKYIRDRMKELQARDTRVEKTVELLEGMLKELHERNISTLKALGVDRPERSRKWKKNVDLKKEVEEKMKPKEEEAPEEEAAPARMPPSAGDGGGRGDLLAALGRGRGRGAPESRGGLLDAIKSGRGGGRGRGDAGGRGGLMAGTLQYRRNLATRSRHFDCVPVLRMDRNHLMFLFCL